MAPKKFPIMPGKELKRKKMHIPRTFVPDKDLDKKVSELLGKAPLASTLKAPWIPHLRNKNTVCYLDFEIPVRDSENGKKVVECLKEISKISSRKGRRLSKYYFSRSRKAFKKLKESDWDVRGPFLEMLTSLDDDYLLSNKITLKIFKEYRSNFERYIRINIEDKNSSSNGGSKFNSEFQTPYLKTDFWNKPVTIKYNRKEGFKTEDPADMEKFSFLKGLLSDFLKDNEEVLKKLKSDSNLTYSLKIKLCQGGFLCGLKEASVVKKAGMLNSELHELEDKPKELASKIDELQERADEILSKTGVESITDIIPLDYFVNFVKGIEFSENGLKAFFFDDYDLKTKGFRPTHFCFIFDKDKRKLEKEYESRDDGAIKYINGGNVKNVMDRLYEERFTYLRYSEVRKEIKRIEDACLIKQGIRFKNDLERILKVKDLELPPVWYVLRNLLYNKASDVPQGVNRSMIRFAGQMRESATVTRMFDYIRRGEE